MLQSHKISTSSAAESSAQTQFPDLDEAFTAGFMGDDDTGDDGAGEELPEEEADEEDEGILSDSLNPKLSGMFWLLLSHMLVSHKLGPVAQLQVNG